MKIQHWFAAGALGCAHLAAVAQQAPEPQRPQDADAAVPALTYTSVFVAAAPAPDVTPDKAWRHANEQVANPDSGHAGHAPKDDAAAKKPQPANAPPKQQHQHEAHKHD